MLPVGIELYTVRDVLQTDFEGTLSALAEMGYRGVEFAFNFGGVPPDDLAALLGRLGLRACGIYERLESLLDASSDAYAYAKAVGSPYVTTGLANEVQGDWDTAIRNIAEAGRVAREQGFMFTYHNHGQEFDRIGGRRALDLLLEQTDPETVGAEFDVHYVSQGGEEPAAYIRKYAGRVHQIHLKDTAPDGKGHIEVGRGLLDIPAVFDAARDAGVRWVIVEQEKDFWQNSSLESARLSLENLKKLGFA